MLGLIVLCQYRTEGVVLVGRGCGLGRAESVVLVEQRVWSW